MLIMVNNDNSINAIAARKQLVCCRRRRRYCRSSSCKSRRIQRRRGSTERGEHDPLEQLPQPNQTLRSYSISNRSVCLAVRARETRDEVRCGRRSTFSLVQCLLELRSDCARDSPNARDPRARGAGGISSAVAAARGVHRTNPFGPLVVCYGSWCGGAGVLAMPANRI